MEDKEFNQKVDDILLMIEEALESSDADLDWDLAGGILTIECGDECHFKGSQVIINRQTPTQQIWVATRGGGYHFDFHEGKGDEKDSWLQGDLKLFTLLSQALSEQTGQSVTLD